MLRSKGADLVERMQVFAPGQNVLTKLTLGFGQNAGMRKRGDCGLLSHEENLQFMNRG